MARRGQTGRPRRIARPLREARPPRHHARRLLSLPPDGVPFEAKQHLQAQEDWLLAAADHSASLLRRPLPRGHLASLKRCIRARFRKQRRWLDSGLHTWDFSIGLSRIVSGRLPGG